MPSLRSIAMALGVAIATYVLLKMLCSDEQQQQQQQAKQQQQAQQAKQAQQQQQAKQAKQAQQQQQAKQAQQQQQQQAKQAQQFAPGGLVVTEPPADAASGMVVKDATTVEVMLENGKLTTSPDRDAKQMAGLPASYEVSWLWPGEEVSIYVVKNGADWKKYRTNHAVWFQASKSGRKVSFSTMSNVSTGWLTRADAPAGTRMGVRYQRGKATAFVGKESFFVDNNVGPGYNTLHFVFDKPASSGATPPGFKVTPL